MAPIPARLAQVLQRTHLQLVGICAASLVFAWFEGMNETMLTECVCVCLHVITWSRYILLLHHLSKPLRLKAA